MHLSTLRCRTRCARQSVVAALLISCGASSALAQQQQVAAPASLPPATVTVRPLPPVASPVQPAAAVALPIMPPGQVQQASATFPVAQAAPAEEKKDEGYVVGSDMAMTASFKNGLELKSKHGDFRLHIGGRTQFDGVWLEDNAGFYQGAGGVGDADAVNFRRARLRIDGTAYEVMEFALEYDFANNVNDNVGLQPADENTNIINVTAPTDLWWEFKEVPWVGHIKIGNMKEPLGLEHNTSSRFLDFMERSYNQDAFTGPFNNGFSPGIMFWDTLFDNRALIAVGAFKNTNNVFVFDTGDGEGALTGRFTCLPWFDEPSKGRRLLHLGINGSFRDLDNNGRLRVRSRASLRNGPGALNPVLADTGFINGDNQTLVGPEAALVLGPLLIQSEYMTSYLNNASSGGVDRGTVFYHGYYCEALYFLTGEHRLYEAERGAFGRVVPHENAYLVRSGGGRGWCFCRGAWQVGARFSHLDLRDAGIDGGVIQDVTLGLNWFLNPNFKFQWNYVYTDRDAAGAPDGGHSHGVGARVAHDF
ncbi:MAG: porin [Planctomycetia bacterium]|nr:porin [Planctomycetia bacterium]